jgi:hypothetical protein
MSDEIQLHGNHLYVIATATLVSDDSSIKVTGCAREALDKKGMDAAQMTGTASSYARKYALNGLFAIDDTKEADSNEYKQETTVKEKEATAEEKQVKAQKWVNSYLKKLEGIDERELINLQADETKTLKRIADDYPELHKVIQRKTDEIRPPSPSGI